MTQPTQSKKIASSDIADQGKLIMSEQSTNGLRADTSANTKEKLGVGFKVPFLSGGKKILPRPSMRQFLSGGAGIAVVCLDGGFTGGAILTYIVVNSAIEFSGGVAKGFGEELGLYGGKKVTGWLRKRDQENRIKFKGENYVRSNGGVILPEDSSQKIMNEPKIYDPNKPEILESYTQLCRWGEETLPDHIEEMVPVLKLGADGQYIVCGYATPETIEQYLSKQELRQLANSIEK